LQLDDLLKIDLSLVVMKSNSAGSDICESVDEIKAVEIDSRKCKAGCLFVAYQGLNVDGHDYIDDAVKNGARFILVKSGFVEKTNEYDNVIFISHDDPKSILSKILSIFYKDKPEYIAFVTGTNGKSSVACFVSQLWRLLGYKAASIGTLGIQKNDITEFGGGLTTPDIVTMHKELCELKNLGYQYVVIETSSHGLDMGRLSGIESNISAFLNITRDHLDYHGDFESYFKAKLQIFDYLKENNSASLINSDIKEFELINEHLTKKILNSNVKNLTFGKKGNYIKLLKSSLSLSGRNVVIEYNNNEYEFFFPFLNHFQVSNLLCAMSIVLHSGMNIEKIISGISGIKNVPGRMELASISKNNDVPIYVDYAHTPDALDNILKSCREYVNSTNGKIILVFGCGGDRDKGKRKIMGKIASDNADLVIVTDDNPRTENPDDIRNDIISECSKAENISSRESAVYRAIELSAKGDIVIIAGKGHEKYQIVGSIKIEFDDVSVVKKALNEIEMIA